MTDLHNPYMQNSYCIRELESTCTEACKQMQKGRGNISVQLFPVLKCGILSSLNQYKHEGSFIPSTSIYNPQERN